jgi:hypothetical protein
VYLTALEGSRSFFTPKEISVLLDQILAMGFYGFVCFVSVVFLYQRWRWGRTRRGFRPSAVMLGNALQQLQVIAQPETRYVIEEKLDEDSEDEESGGPDDPVRHLHRQAAKIRRGEPVERITTLLKKRRE